MDRDASAVGPLRRCRASCASRRRHADLPQRPRTGSCRASAARSRHARRARVCRRGCAAPAPCPSSSSTRGRVCRSVSGTRPTRPPSRAVDKPRDPFPLARVCHLRLLPITRSVSWVIVTVTSSTRGASSPCSTRGLLDHDAALRGRACSVLDRPANLEVQEHAPAARRVGRDCGGDGATARLPMIAAYVGRRRWRRWRRWWEWEIQVAGLPSAAAHRRFPPWGGRR